jgi:CBS domain-containing protein
MRAEARGRPTFRPQGFAPRSPAAQGSLVALVLGASGGATLLQRRRATRGRIRWPGGPVAVAIRQQPFLAASVGAGAGALAVGYLFFRGRRAARRVKDAMTSNPQAVAPSMPLGEAAQLMKREDVGALPVVENGRLVGVLTDRDIVVRVVAEARDAQALQVGDVASRELVTAAPDQPLDEALRLMARHRVRRLPVVDGDRLVGILAQADVALESGERNVGAAVRQISKPGVQARV